MTPGGAFSAKGSLHHQLRLLLPLVDAVATEDVTTAESSGFDELDPMLQKPFTSVIS